MNRKFKNNNSFIKKTMELNLIKLLERIIIIILAASIIILGITSYLAKDDPEFNFYANVLTFLGSLIGGIATLIAIYVTIIQSNKAQNEEFKKNVEFSKNIINTYLIHEIKYNFNNVLGSKNLFYNRFKNENHPTRFSYRNNEIKTDEFNKIKYELIKYNNETVNEVIELYDMFEIFKSKRGIEEFTQKEFDNIKPIYLKNINKYLE